MFSFSFAGDLSLLNDKLRIILDELDLDRAILKGDIHRRDIFGQSKAFLKPFASNRLESNNMRSSQADKLAKILKNSLEQVTFLNTNLLSNV